MKIPCVYVATKTNHLIPNTLEKMMYAMPIYIHENKLTAPAPLFILLLSFQSERKSSNGKAGDGEDGN